MNIPVAKPYLDEKDAQAAYTTILSGWVTQGPEVQKFEEAFANYVGSKYAIAVSNCTTALFLSLVVAGITEGDEVICPSMTFIATANAIKQVGATPVFGEVNEHYNLDINHTKTLITAKTKAILLVHQIGMPADIEAFQTLCKLHNLILIEDAACAIGSEYKGKKIGSHSDLVCFSFHPRKVITTGEGGMISTSNEKYYNRLKLLRQHGMSINDRIRHESKKVILEDYLEVGYNFRMTDIQASIGIQQLIKLNYIIAERKKIAQKYINAFQNFDCIQLPLELEGYNSSYQSFSITLKANSPISRDELMQKLLDIGISTRRGIMTIHREIAYNENYKEINLPVTEKVSDSSFIIPLYVPMSQNEIDFVIENISLFLTK